MALSGTEPTELLILLTVGTILVTVPLSVAPLKVTEPKTFKVTLTVKNFFTEPFGSRTRAEMFPENVTCIPLGDMVEVGAWVAVISTSTVAFG